MNPTVLSMALLCGFALAGLLVIFLACFRGGRALQAGIERGGVRQKQLEAEIECLKTLLEALTGEIRQMERQLAPPAGALPKGTLNLGKRSQVIRMHRRGETPAHIAASLEIPQQEVDLLLKVHQIVISSV